MTPHQCQNVCDWETAERDQPCEAQLSPPTCTHRNVRKTNLPTVAITLSKRGAHPPINLLNYFPQRGDKGKDGTPSFQRHTMFKLYQIFEGNRLADTAQKARRSRSFSFRTAGVTLSTGLSNILHTGGLVCVSLPFRLLSVCNECGLGMTWNARNKTMGCVHF